MTAEPTNSLPIPAPVRRNLWKRWWDSPPTRRQMAVDIAFGIVLPIVCFTLDFGFVLGSVLGGHREPFVLSGFWVAALTLGAWLALGRRLGWGRTIVAGVLGTSAAVAGLIGLTILPLVLVGLMWSIADHGPAVAIFSLLGLVPLAAALSYGRNAPRAFGDTEDVDRKATAIGISIGVTVIFGLAMIGQVATMAFVADAVAVLPGGSVETVDEAIDRVQWVAPLCRADCAAPLRDAVVPRAIERIEASDVAMGLRWLRRLPGCESNCASYLVGPYMYSTTPADRERLSAAYQQLTGKDIAEAAAAMRRHND